MAQHNTLGQRGERVAARYLQEHGYQVVARNWRYGQQELDLIAWEQPQELLVFVEVKTRSTTYFGYPEAAVDSRKQELLINAANAFLEAHELACELRFDVIALVIQGQQVHELNHVKDAIIP